MDGRATAAVLVAEDEPLAFASVGAALAHARGLQPGGRVGVAAGTEPQAAAVAARLRDAAEPGQVLVTDAARWADSDGDPFRDAGPLDRGGAAIHAWELLWAEPVPRTRVRLCGEPALAIDGERLEAPGGQAGALLGYLLASPERAADRAELIEVLWPGRAPRDPQAALRPILSRLRRALGPAELEGRERLRLRLPEPVWTDLGAAADALAAARSAARGEQWAPARAHAQAALRLLRPGFLPGVDDDWVTAPRLEAEELELEALEWIARASLALGGPELAAAERAGRELVSRSPFRETGHRFLMEALAGGGNVAEALRVYDDLRVLLRDELGTAPAGELQALHQRLLTGTPARAEIAPEPPPVALPRRLAPRKRSAFVARDGELERLRAAWDEARGGSRRLVAVAGEPGIGKTRLATEFADAARRGRDRPVRRVPAGRAPPLPAVRGGAAGRGARLGAGRGDAGRRRAVPRHPRAAGRAGRTGGRRRAPALPAVRGHRLAAGRDRRAGAARADPRRPALGRPRHAPPPAPCRPRAAPGLRAHPRHLPRRRGAAVAPARGAARRPPPRRARGADRARGPGGARRRRADRRPRRPRRPAVARGHGPRAHRRQPVLRRGGPAPPDRERHRVRARRPLDLRAHAGRDRGARGRAGGAGAAASPGCRIHAAPRSRPPPCSAGSARSTCSSRPGRRARTS